jgi:hypothetical protein
MLTPIPAKSQDAIEISQKMIETMETLQADKNLAKYSKMLSLGYNKDAILDKLMDDKKLVDERVIDDDERSRLEVIQRNRVIKYGELSRRNATFLGDCL